MSLKHFFSTLGAGGPNKLLTNCVSLEHQVCRYPPGLGWHAGLSGIHFSSLQETLPQPPTVWPAFCQIHQVHCSEHCHRSAKFFSTDSPLTRVGCTSSTDCTELSRSRELQFTLRKSWHVLLPSSCWAPATGTEKSSVTYRHRMDSRLWSTNKSNHRYQCSVGWKDLFTHTSAWRAVLKWKC